MLTESQQNNEPNNVWTALKAEKGLRSGTFHLTAAEQVGNVIYSI